MDGYVPLGARAVFTQYRMCKRGGPVKIGNTRRTGCTAHWPEGQRINARRRGSLVLSRARSWRVVSCRVVSCPSPISVPQSGVACIRSTIVSGTLSGSSSRSWHGIQGTWALHPRVTHHRIGPELSATESRKKASLLVSIAVIEVIARRFNKGVSLSPIKLQTGYAVGTTHPQIKQIANTSSYRLHARQTGPLASETTCDPLFSRHATRLRRL